MMKTTVLILLAIFPILVFAQSGSSTISGTVKDSSGAPIPAAKVKISNADTGFATQVLANESGSYRVGSLVPGSYRVEAEVEGFERLVRSSVGLQEYEVLTIYLSLVVRNENKSVPV